MTDAFDNDAWKQHDDFIRKHTRKSDIRRDLRVTALAHERSVRLEIADPNKLHPKFSSMPSWNGTTRGIFTMRELAKAINEACDFVEAANPEWAKRIRGEGAIRVIDDGSGKTGKTTSPRSTSSLLSSSDPVD